MSESNSSEQPKTFAELLALARTGDELAMVRLVELYEPEVRLVTRAHLGAPLRPYLDSVDIVQSVHRSLMVGIRGDRFEFSEPRQLVALAATIVRRKIARQWRRAKRQTRQDATSSTADALSVTLLQRSAEVDPQSAVALRDQLNHLLLHMATVERQLIELRLQGLTTADAARQLGLDRDVCRVRLSRLRKRLREIGLWEGVV